jgi:uncharacterized membrane protein
MLAMIKGLFTFRKEDVLMWAGLGTVSLIVVVLMTVFTTNGLGVVDNIVGIVMMLLMPGYVLVKLFLDDFRINDNVTKNPDVNKAVDKLILSFGCGMIAVIPLNFVWNYLLRFGGNVEDEAMLVGSASWRALFTLILVVGGALGYKIYTLKKQSGSN